MPDQNKTYPCALTILVCLTGTLIGCSSESPPPPKDVPKQAAKDGWKDPYTGIEFVYVQGGTFQMGDFVGDGSFDERPVHEVTVSDYYIAKHEVTQAQWEKLMGDNPSEFDGANNPVDSVSWNEIQAFIKALNGKSGQRYRLPTEAEWEYAARSGGKREKWAGTNDENQVGEYAWYLDNSDQQSHPVGTKKPNGLGIHDMSGSLWEWVHDWYDLYPSTAQTDPKGPDQGKWGYRTYRGGAWDYIPLIVSVFNRSGHVPDYKRPWIGFRLAKDVKP